MPTPVRVHPDPHPDPHGLCDPLTRTPPVPWRTWRALDARLSRRLGVPHGRHTDTGWSAGRRALSQVPTQPAPYPDTHGALCRQGTAAHLPWRGRRATPAWPCGRRCLPQTPCLACRPVTARARRRHGLRTGYDGEPGAQQIATPHVGTACGGCGGSRPAGQGTRYGRRVRNLPPAVVVGGAHTLSPLGGQGFLPRAQPLTPRVRRWK